MLKPDPTLRPSADVILEQAPKVKIAGNRCEEFLRDYIKGIEAYDRVEEERLALEQREADERYVSFIYRPVATFPRGITRLTRNNLLSCCFIRGQTPRNAHGKGVVRARHLLAGSPPPTITAPAIFTPEPAASH